MNKGKKMILDCRKSDDHDFIMTVQNFLSQQIIQYIVESIRFSDNILSSAKKYLKA